MDVEDDSTAPKHGSLYSCDTLTVFVATLNANSRLGDQETVNALLRIEGNFPPDLVVGVFIILWNVAFSV